MENFKEMLRLVEETNKLAKQVVENQRKINEYFDLGLDELGDTCDCVVSFMEKKIGAGTIVECKEEGISERVVSEFLTELGIPTHIKGYRYVMSSILLAVEDFGIIDSITKELYPTVAKEYKTTPSRVERAIRHAIEIAWNRGNVDTLQNLFGYTISATKGKPTNSEFIAMIATKLSYKN